jgi:hypothetical protein
MDFIKVNTTSKDSICRRVNVNHIIFYSSQLTSTGSYVTWIRVTHDETIAVKETPEEIDVLIYEARNG